MERTFTLDEAQALLPELREVAAELVSARADLMELQMALSQGQPSQLGGRAEAKALEARMSELLSWFPAQGLQIRGWAPLLLDFPSQLDGEDVLLCWLEGDETIAWYHRPEHGFAGRRRLPQLGDTTR
jgi:hypothetical protein